MRSLISQKEGPACQNWLKSLGFRVKGVGLRVQLMSYWVVYHAVVKLPGPKP